MNLEECIDFLQNHQPMPQQPEPKVMDQFKAITEFLYHHPEPVCIPLLLHAFAYWEDDSVAESVQSVIRRFPKEEVLEHLQAAVTSEHAAVRSWCAETMSFFPDVCLLPHLAELLRDPEREIRLAGAIALECIDSGSARKTAAKALIHEGDEDVRDILQSICRS